MGVIQFWIKRKVKRKFMKLYKYTHFENDKGVSINVKENIGTSGKVISWKEYYKLCGNTSWELRQKGIDIFTDISNEKAFNIRNKYYEKFWEESKREIYDFFIVFVTILGTSIMSVITTVLLKYLKII